MVACQSVQVNSMRRFWCLLLLLLFFEVCFGQAQNSTRDIITNTVDTFWIRITKIGGEVYYPEVIEWFERYLWLGDDIDVGVFEDNFCDLYDEGSTSFKSDFGLDDVTCQAFFRVLDLRASSMGEVVMRVNVNDIDDLFDFCDYNDEVVYAMNETHFKSCFQDIFNGLPFALQYMRRANLSEIGDYREDGMDKTTWDTWFPEIDNGTGSVGQLAFRNYWNVRQNHGPDFDADSAFSTLTQWPRDSGDAPHADVTQGSMDALFAYLEFDMDGWLDFEEYSRMGEMFSYYMFGLDPFPPPA